MTEPPSFTCPDCGATSHHPRDALEGYCGACHEFTGLVDIDQILDVGKQVQPRDPRAFRELWEDYWRRRLR